MVVADCAVPLARFLRLQVGVVPFFSIKQNKRRGKHTNPVFPTHTCTSILWPGDAAACSPQALLHLVPVGSGLGDRPAARAPQRREHTAWAPPSQALFSVMAWPWVGWVSLPGRAHHAHAHSPAVGTDWSPASSCFRQSCSGGCLLVQRRSLEDVLGGSGPHCTSTPLPLPAFSRESRETLHPKQPCWGQSRAVSVDMGP